MSTELIAISIDALADSGGVTIIQDSPVGGSRPETFAWPDFPPKVTSMLERWFAASDEVPPKEVGNALFQHLFPMASRAALKSAFAQARAADRALVAISSSSSTLHGLPFEIAHDGEEYLVSANRVVFRHINDGAKIEPTYSEPRRFLVVLAEPSSKGDYPAWGHDQFADQIRGLLSQRDGDIDLLCHATPVQVQDALASERSVRGRYDVVLVVAHGEPPTGSGDGSLVLEGP